MAKKKPQAKNYRPTIKNRKARFEYEFIQQYTAGMVLSGTEIKSIRNGKVQFADAYCIFKDGELFVRELHISPYTHGNIFNQDPRRERKLLLSKRELERLKKASEEKGLTIVPTKLFFNERNFAKLDIALAKGKKLYDKRNDIKDRDLKRSLNESLNH